MDVWSSAWAVVDSGVREQVELFRNVPRFLDTYSISLRVRCVSYKTSLLALIHNDGIIKVTQSCRGS